METTIYFQKQRTSSYTHSEKQGGVSVQQVISPDTITLKDFNTDAVAFVLADYDYRPVGEIKEPYKNEWHDEHGDDEYIPDELMMEAYELELTIGCKFTPNNATPSIIPTSVSKEIKKLINYFKCGGEFMFLIPDSELGKRNVRFQSYDDDSKMYKQKVVINGNTNYEYVLQFKVTLKVNDPDYVVSTKMVILPGEKRILI